MDIQFYQRDIQICDAIYAVAKRMYDNENFVKYVTDANPLKTAQQIAKITYTEIWHLGKETFDKYADANTIYRNSPAFVRQGIAVNIFNFEGSTYEINTYMLFVFLERHLKLLPVNIRKKYTF